MDRRVTPRKRVTSPTWGPPLHLRVNRPSEGRESSCKYGGGLTTYYYGDILSSLMINTILLWHGRSFTFRAKILQTFNGIFVRYLHHRNGR